MTDTSEMLAASPAVARLGVAEVGAAIDACLNCVQACTSCADADLAEEDVAELRTCIALDQNCAALCDVTARVLSRPAHWDEFVVHRPLQACVRECTLCAEECARHADHHRHCAICAKALRACVQACSALLDAEAFEELQKLAGGYRACAYPAARLSPCRQVAASGDVLVATPGKGDDAHHGR